ncbi:MAG: hypothetical protein ACOCYT_00525 [Chloroflexota bacterium]
MLLTPARLHAYGLMTLAVMLAMLAAAGQVVASTGGMSARVTVVAGLLLLVAAGVYVAADRPDGRLRGERLLLPFTTVWAAAGLIAVIMPGLLPVWQAALTGMSGAIGWGAGRSPDSALVVWAFSLAFGGMLAAARHDDLALLAGWIPAVLALSYWLVGRFSTVPEPWRREAVRRIGGLALLTGLTVSLIASSRSTDAVPVVRHGAAAVTLLAWVIILAHGHLTLVNPVGTKTLVAYWSALAWLLLALGVTLPLLAGDVLRASADLLARWGIIACGLGLVNQAAAELRHNPRRVTGLLPFWLVGGGLLVAALGLALNSAAPHASAYLWLARSGCVMVFAGMAIYTLAFLLRRP